MSKYTVSAIDSLLSKLSEMKYELYQIQEGCLGCGDWICLPPDEKHYGFEIREVYLNEWSSAHTVRRFRKVSRRQWNLINNIQ